VVQEVEKIYKLLDQLKRIKQINLILNRIG
jgi:hypothetical protein